MSLNNWVMDNSPYLFLILEIVEIDELFFRTYSCYRSKSSSALTVSSHTNDVDKYASQCWLLKKGISPLHSFLSINIKGTYIHLLGRVPSVRHEDLNLNCYLTGSPEVPLMVKLQGEVTRDWHCFWSPQFLILQPMYHFP